MHRSWERLFLFKVTFINANFDIYKSIQNGHHIRGGSDPTPGTRNPNLFGPLGSVRWDPDLLVNDSDLKEDPDPI